MLKNLLIIEDDQEMCRELNETLTELDYNVQTIFDGTNGKKLIKKNKYDVIILDLKIPNFDGYQILNYINQKKINVKIIVTTARMKINYGDSINQNQEKNENDILKIADFVLIKPYKTTDLIKILKKL